MLVLPKSAFLHFPKTGGNWVRCAIGRSGIVTTEVGEMHDHKRPPGKFTFCFLRKPDEWYISRWRCPWHRERLARSEPKHIDCANEHEARDFNLWVQRILCEWPAHLSNAYRNFLQHADYVAPTDRLVSGLDAALTMAGESYDRPLLLGTPRVHESQIACPEYKPEVHEQLVSVEAEAFKLYAKTANTTVSMAS